MQKLYGNGRSNHFCLGYPSMTNHEYVIVLNKIHEMIQREKEKLMRTLEEAQELRGGELKFFMPQGEKVAQNQKFLRFWRKKYVNFIKLKEKGEIYARYKV